MRSQTRRAAQADRPDPRDPRDLAAAQRDAGQVPRRRPQRQGQRRRGRGAAPRPRGAVDGEAVAMTSLTPAYLVSKRQSPPPPPSPRARRPRTPATEQFTDDDLL